MALVAPPVIVNLSNPYQPGPLTTVNEWYYEGIPKADAAKSAVTLPDNIEVGTTVHLTVRA